MRITLFPDEIAAAVAVASRRRIECQRSRRKPVRFEQDGAQRWGVEIEAACSEVVVSRVLNLAWTGISKAGTYDVGGCVEVRHSIHPDAHLIIYAEDEEAPFVLVTGRDGAYEVRGWEYPNNARERYPATNGRNGSVWVPQSELRPIEDLRDSIVMIRARKAGERREAVRS